MISSAREQLCQRGSLTKQRLVRLNVDPVVDDLEVLGRVSVDAARRSSAVSAEVYAPEARLGGGTAHNIVPSSGSQ